MPRQWQIPADTEVLIEYLDDSAAVYCIGSGQTHVVDAFPAEVLRLMPQGVPVDTQSLSARVAESVGDTATWRVEVEAVLQRLEQMGIVAAVAV